MSYRYSNQKIAGFIKKVWAKEVSLSFTKSSGPGGQNINKNETKVQLTWDLKETSVIPKEYRKKLEERNTEYLTQERVIRIDTSVHRTQKANKEQTQKKLAKIIKKAFKKEPLKKGAKPAPKRVVDRRIAQKRKRSKTRVTRKKFYG